MRINRREFLRGAAVSAASLSTISALSCDNVELPLPEGSGIEHIIVVMMENRSFDHMLGWLPAHREERCVLHRLLRGVGPSGAERAGEKFHDAGQLLLVDFVVDVSEP